MKTLLLVLAVMLTPYNISVADDCVPLDVVVKHWGRAINHTSPSTGQIAMTLECDPCKCPSQFGMEDCYRFRADQAKAEREAYEAELALWKRVKEHGVCR